MSSIAGFYDLQAVMSNCRLSGQSAIYNLQSEMRRGGQTVRLAYGHGPLSGDGPQKQLGTASRR